MPQTILTPHPNDVSSFLHPPTSLLHPLDMRARGRPGASLIHLVLLREHHEVLGGAFLADDLLDDLVDVRDTRSLPTRRQEYARRRIRAHTRVPTMSVPHQQKALEMTLQGDVVPPHVPAVLVSMLSMLPCLCLHSQGVEPLGKSANKRVGHSTWQQRQQLRRRLREFRQCRLSLARKTLSCLPVAHHLGVAMVKHS